jgi:hypothetical protein
MTIVYVEVDLTYHLSSTRQDPTPYYLYYGGATLINGAFPGTNQFGTWVNADDLGNNTFSYAIVEGAVGNVYTSDQFATLPDGPFLAYTPGTSEYLVVPGSLPLGNYPIAIYTNDNYLQRLPTSYGYGYTRVYEEVDITTPNLFTSGTDTVNFNALTNDQQSAISSGANLYNALGGGDTITLPNATSTDTNITLAGTATTFDLTHTFVLGDNAGDTTSITGGNGSYNIALGAGADTVTINGDGNSNITAGSGSDTITINGTGMNSVTAGSGPETLSVSGGGTLVVNGNLSGGSATIGANSILELKGTDSGSITFDGANATLKIDSTTMPTGVESGFAAGDHIVLVKTEFQSLQSGVFIEGPDQLSIVGSGPSVSLNLQGHYLDALVTSDPSGGIDIKEVSSPISQVENAGDVKSFLDATDTFVKLVAAVYAKSPRSFAELKDVLDPVFTTFGTAADATLIYQKAQQTLNDPNASDQQILKIWSDATTEAVDLMMKAAVAGVLAAGAGVLLAGVAAAAVEGSVLGGFLLAVGVAIENLPAPILLGTAIAGTATYDAYWNTYLKQPVDQWIEQNIVPHISSRYNIPVYNVQDGYLSGTTVFSDDNHNSELDSGERFAITDSTGSFSPLIGTGPLVAIGGTDISTGLPFKGQFSAPAGSEIISPLTTILDALQADPSAQQKIMAALGLSSTLNLTMFDPIAAAQVGSADGAATEVADAKVYDTVEIIASALVGAGGQFTPSLQAAFTALATAVESGGINLSDQTAVSALITQVAQAENITLGTGVADGVAAVIAAGNAALDHVLRTDQPGSTLLNDTAAVELVMQGPASTAIQQAANDPTRLQNVVSAFTGTSLDTLISSALNQLGPDTDTGEQAALKLTINSGAATPLGASIAGNVPFTIAGLKLEDVGTVQFTDSNGKTVQVNVNGGQTSYTVNLSSLADGQITSALAVDTDPAGNSFTPVAGNAVSLDTNAAFAPVLQVDGGTANVFVNAITAKAVPVTLTGLETGDTGTVTFTDATGHTIPLAVSANQTSYTVDLSSLADGAITSSLLVIDAASNAGTAIGNPVVLDQDKVAEAPILTIADRSLTVRSGGSIPLGIKVTPVDGDDTVLVMISGVPQGFESITADDGHAPVSHHGANYTFTAADVNAGLTLHSTYRGGGHPVNQLTVTASNTTAGETAEATPVSITITDLPTSSPACSSSGSKSLGDLIAQFGAKHDFHRSASDAVFDRRDHGVGTKTYGVITDIAALIERFIGGHTASGGAPGFLGNATAAEEQKALLAIHHG